MAKSLSFLSFSSFTFFSHFNKDCQRWCLFRCQNISKTDRKLWHKPSLMYICLSCRNDALGMFDFVKGLERLTKDSLASYEQLTISVEREKLLLKKGPLDASVHEDFSYQRQDLIANAIFLQYTVSTEVALHSTGNGDCLFNSFSTYLVGDESRAVELRYRCCIEM